MSKKVQLFCIPYAGGRKDYFNVIKKYLNPDIEIISVDYAGHGKRKKEDFYPNFDSMVDDMALQFNARWNRESETVIFGYSMGSVVAYEMLAQQKLDFKPIHIFLAANEAPDIEWDSKEVCHLSNEELAEFLVTLGGFGKFDKKMLNNKVFMNMYFNPIVHDYQLLGAYKMSSYMKIDGDVTLLYSSKDIEEDRFMEWKRFVNESSRFYDIGKNHFFMTEYPKEVAEIINQRVSESRRNL